MQSDEHDNTINIGKRASRLLLLLNNKLQQ